MVWIVVGAVLLVVAVVLFFLLRSKQGRLQQIRAVETSTAQDLATLASSVARELGQGGRFAQVAEVKGVVKCDSPLTSEISSQPCVYYSSEIHREYDETYWETDSQTKARVQKTRRGSEKVAGNTRGVPFWVEDASGRIKVEPDGASVDAEKVVDRFEQNEPVLAGGLLSLRGVTLNVGGLQIAPSGGRQTLGYRLRERVLPLERRVYVLGEASDASGELSIRKPSEHGRAFVISLKSEEELLRSAGSTVRWLGVGAAASGIVGVVLIVVGLVR